METLNEMRDRMMKTSQEDALKEYYRLKEVCIGGIAKLDKRDFPDMAEFGKKSVEILNKYADQMAVIITIGVLRSPRQDTFTYVEALLNRYVAEKVKAITVGILGEFDKSEEE